MRLDTRFLLPRITLDTTYCDRWPKPRPHCKYELYFGYGAHVTTPFHDEVNLKALRVAKQRPDIDYLELNLEMLFHEEFRRHVAELLDADDRLWSVKLKSNENCEITHRRRRCLDIAALQRKRLLEKCLFIFRKVKSLSVFHCSPTKSKGLFLFRCMPVFEQLEDMDLCGLRVSQDELDELMDLPFAPLISGLVIDDAKYLERQPVFSKTASKRLHALSLNLPGEVISTTSMLIEGLTTLPSLHHLSVELMEDTYGANSVMASLPPLLKWLTRPQCPVVELSLSLERCGLVEPSSLTPWIFKHLAQVPNLKTLELVCFFHLTNDEIDTLIQALKNSPSIEYVYLSVCSMEERSSWRKLLDFQLQSRPRMITIQPKCETMDDEEEHESEEWFAIQERFYQITFLYQLLRNYHQSLAKRQVQPAIWPLLLEKLGNTCCYNPSITVQEAGIDAIYGILPRLLGDLYWTRG